MNDQFNVETAQAGEHITRMRGVSFTDATEFANQLAREKVRDGYQVIDTRHNLILMQSATFKAFAIRIVKMVKVSA